MRIATGGLHTESSTFNPLPMQASDFRILRGAQITDHAEFQVLGECPATFLPTLHARAVPGGPIARPAYEALKAEFLDRLSSLGRIDGVYLAMHGAAAVEGLDDAEADWIGAARAVVGPDCPIAASYDLHGNVSQRIIDSLDMFSAYRTAPHIDVDATKRRACAMLCRCLESGERPFLAWAPIPVLLPGERTSTVDPPARALYARLPELDARDGVWDASLLVGYVWADQPRAAASAVVTGTDTLALRQAVRELALAYWNTRENFDFGTACGSVEWCLDQALASPSAPVILADSGDNPTGGGVGDRADLLRAVLARNAVNVLIVGIADRPATKACHQAGVGARLPLRIGATLDPHGSEPVDVIADVTRLTPDHAVVGIGGITLVLSARRRPFHDLADFHALGLDPAGARILIVKSGYLSPDLAKLANPGLLALSPGVVDQDVTRAGRHHIPRPTFPFDRDFDWQPQDRLSARVTFS